MNLFYFTFLAGTTGLQVHSNTDDAALALQVHSDAGDDDALVSPVFFNQSPDLDYSIKVHKASETVKRTCFGCKTSVVYDIETKIKDIPRNVERSYKDFKVLHKLLKKKLGKQFPVPKLPEQRTDDKEGKRVDEQLGNWLISTIQVSPGVNADLCKFLGVVDVMESQTATVKIHLTPENVGSFWGNKRSKYTIEVLYGSDTKTFDAFYSDFVDVHKSLVDSGIAKNITVPFPTRDWKWKFSSKFLQKRTTNLQNWLQAAICADPYFTNDKLMAFLGAVPLASVILEDKHIGNIWDWGLNYAETNWLGQPKRFWGGKPTKFTILYDKRRILKRYSEFEALNQQLVKLDIQADFPQKRLWSKLNFFNEESGKEFLEKRADELDQWLQAVLTADPGLTQKPLRNFLKLSEMFTNKKKTTIHGSDADMAAMTVCAKTKRWRKAQWGTMRAEAGLKHYKEIQNNDHIGFFAPERSQFSRDLDNYKEAWELKAENRIWQKVLDNCGDSEQTDPNPQDVDCCRLTNSLPFTDQTSQEKPTDNATPDTARNSSVLPATYDDLYNPIGILR